jgi:hypothetical protein
MLTCHDPFLKASKSMLEEHESAMLDFVIRSMKQPGSINAADIKRLKDLDWEERDMVDAPAMFYWNGSW